MKSIVLTTQLILHCLNFSGLISQRTRTSMFLLFLYFSDDSGAWHQNEMFAPVLIQEIWSTCNVTLHLPIQVIAGKATNKNISYPVRVNKNLPNWAAELPSSQLLVILFFLRPNTAWHTVGERREERCSRNDENTYSRIKTLLRCI